MTFVGMDKTMFNFKRSKSLLKNFRKNNDGNMALTFALSMTLVVTAVGAATDFSALSSAHSKSQSVADSLALAAAIYIKDHDRPPPTDAEGLRDGVTYTAEQLGIRYTNAIEGGPSNVSIRVDYDDDTKEAVTTITGATAPNFTQIFGKDRLPFRAKSVVSYLEAEDSFPASISLVLDNSGSMAWDDKIALSNGSSPLDAAPRINGLQISVNTFTRELERRLSSTTREQRTIRMGMLPYSSDIVNNARVLMQFGYLTAAQIAQMTPSGQTNSNPPMRAALEELANENEIHRQEANRTGETYIEPLKFVIFMSDGQNTVGSFEFTADENAPFYWRFDSSRNLWRGQFASRFNGDSRYTRGNLTRNSDRLTIESCRVLQEQGTEIFTIGYALDLGFYNTNNRFNSREVREVSLLNQSNAFNLLATCATKEENFVRADNNEELEAAFDTIQNAIVEELIRIKS